MPKVASRILVIRGPQTALTLIPLLDAGTYATSARALCASTTWYLPRERFNFLFATRSDFREAVLAEVASVLRRMVTLTDSISLRRVPARVAARLIEDAENAGAGRTHQGFRLNLTQEELAHLVGSTRESVARALSHFRNAGVIEQRGRRIRILDWTALVQYARSGEDLLASRQALSA
jgi:CRP-like cAMP-binding protein